MSATRIERDPLGELPVPADALYGIQTERARQNFPISHVLPLAPFVDAVVRELADEGVVVPGLHGHPHPFDDLARGCRGLFDRFGH